MKFIIATGNPHKVAEFSRILTPMGIEATTAQAMGGDKLPEVEETGTTFEENAFLKADGACRHTGLPAVADDSGLCVDALDGQPGIYSARYAETDEKCIQKLLKNLDSVPMERRTSRFVSAVCCVFPDGRSFTVRGECEGHIAFEKHGSDGFGYDPVFLYGTGDSAKSFGDMSAVEKDAVSHRGRALELFRAELTKYI